MNNALNRLNLQRRPVAIAFLSEPPAGLSHVARTLPASCAYWQHASEGHSFYTLPGDHYNCPVGAHTHNVELPEDKKRELEGLVGTMIQLQYLRSEEIPRISQRRQPLQVAAYAPLESAPFTPDVVVVRGTPRQLMLVSEAARAAGVFDGADIMGRPACAMLPHAINEGSAVASFGCIGNRVYTGLDEDELYVSIPGSALDATIEKLAVILDANAAMETFHRERRERLS